MDNCAFCNTQTELYVNSVPICSKCSGDREHKSTPTQADIRDSLQAELLEATVRALEAEGKFKAIMKEIPSGLPSPDGAQRIKNALHEVTASRVEMAKAQNRVVAFIDARDSARRHKAQRVITFGLVFPPLFPPHSPRSNANVTRGCGR
jgi:hypothetical protein